jgi:hypothetical protein
VNTLILETVPAAMRASAMAGSIFAIHMFGDLWSPRIVGSLSDRWGDLQRACLWMLPAALVVSAFFWVWLLLVTKRVRPTADENGGDPAAPGQGSEARAATGLPSDL